MRIWVPRGQDGSAPLKGPPMRLASVIAACCAAVLLATAGPAAADSLVFVRDNNVWLSNADGSGQYQVTLDGTPVAYWFVTTVQDPTCVFCVNLSNRVLISHSDRFTHPDEVGTPNTGS